MDLHVPVTVSSRGEAPLAKFPVSAVQHFAPSGLVETSSSRRAHMTDAGMGLGRVG